MTTRWARVVRGSVAAAFSLFVAAFSHVLANGTMPSIFAIAGCLAFSTLVCIALASKQLSLLRLSGSVVLSQFLFHGVFSAWGTVPAGPVEAAHHLGNVQMVMTLASADQYGSATAMTTDGWMWLAHGVAAIVTIAALRYGELAFWGLLAVAQLCIGALFTAMPQAPALLSMRSVPTPSARFFVPRDLVLLLSSMRHRGPPACSALHALTGIA
ncbi:MAG: hypothetical protein ACYCZY_03590 [Lacisediminihabitans sp.]